MSAWGNIYSERTDVVGRIMSAIEQRANGIHDSTEWPSECDDGDGFMNPDKTNPSMLDALEQEIKKLIEGDKSK